MKVEDKLKEKPVISIGRIGFYLGQTYLFFGESLTGKTWICCWIARKLMKKGKKVLYIDTEGDAINWFKRWDRKGLVENTDNLILKDNIVSTEEKEEYLEELEESKEKEKEEPPHPFPKAIKETIKSNEVGVIIIDSIYSPMRGINPRKVARKLETLADWLNDYTGEKEILTLLTSHARGKRGEEGKTNKGGKGLQYETNHKILLKKKKKSTGSKNFMDKKRGLFFDERIQVITKVEDGRLEVVSNEG